MDMEVDHYGILGLPSGEEGAQLSDKDITKAYKAKALKLHPDKRPDDPNAQKNFQKLQASYDILKDEKARKLFDDLLRVKREQQKRRSEQEAKHGSKRRKMVSDLEERERAAAFAPDPYTAARHEEERIMRKLREEIARIQEMHAKKKEGTSGSMPSVGKEESTGGRLDKEKVLKVSWEKVGTDYSAERLKEVFSEFGKVEDVVINSSKKKRGSAIVVMESKDAVTAATGAVCGDLSNPLLVIPLQLTTFSSVEQKDKVDSNLVGAGYQDFEDSVLKKLQKAAQRQK